MAATEGDGALMEKLETYRVAEHDPFELVEFRQKILDVSPQWERFEASGALPKGCARSLGQVAPGHTLKTKEAIQKGPEILEACMLVLSMSAGDEATLQALQYTLTLLLDLLREDSSCFSNFEQAFRTKKLRVDVLQQLMKHDNWYVADKAAWLLTVLIGHAQQYFSQEFVQDVCANLLDTPSKRTELGNLEAITNLLKSERYRVFVWSRPGLPARIFQGAGGETQPSQIVYRRVFAIWTLSFDNEICKSLSRYGVVSELKLILASSRVEKVIRLSLTVLRNLIAIRSLCEDIVEENMLDVVKQLEFEKWRDTELYDSIREVAQTISDKVYEFSNFDRYDRELRSGSMRWGFIHSHKFWSENFTKFEVNNFEALGLLASLLMDGTTDPTTLAVVCHDVGEFVSLHPLGKRKIAAHRIKERVMELMASSDPVYREVRREALLCCQKIMLKRWQDIPGGNAVGGDM